MGSEFVPISAGTGFFRVLTISLQIDDRGVGRGIAAIGARVGLVNKAFGRMADRMKAIQSQMAILAFTGGAIVLGLSQRFAEFETQLVRAANAAGLGTEGIAEMRKQAISLSRVLRRSPVQMAEFTKQLRFFGIESAEAREQLALAAGMLARVGEVSEEKAAKGLLRLIKISDRSGRPLGELLQNSRELASAIFAVGTSITAGPADLIDFLERFQRVGAFAKLRPEQVVAIAGAFADMSENIRATATTAAFRIFQTPEIGPLGRFLNLTEQQVLDLRQTDPAGFLLMLSERLRDVRDSGQPVITVMKELGIGTFRSGKSIFQFIGNLSKAAELLELVENTGRNLSKFNEGFNLQLQTLTAEFESMAAAVERVAIQLSTGMLPAIKLGVRLVEGFAGILEQNPIMARLLGTVGITSLIAGLVGGAGQIMVLRRLMGLPTIGTSFRALTASGFATIAGIPLGQEGAAAAVGQRGLGGFLGSLFGGRFAMPVGGPGALLGFTSALAGTRTGAALGRLGGFAGRVGSTILGPTGSLFGLLGAPGRLLAGALGRVGIGAAGGSLIPIVGQLLFFLPLLAPLLDSLSDFLSTAAEEGSAVDFVLDALSAVIKAISLLGDAIKTVFDIIMRFVFTDLPNILRAIPVIGPAIAGGLEQLETSGDDLLDALDGVERGLKDFREAQGLDPMREDVPTGPTQVNNFNVNAGDGEAAARDIQDNVRSATNSVFGTSSSSVTVG